MQTHSRQDRQSKTVQYQTTDLQIRNRPPPSALLSWQGTLLAVVAGDIIAAQSGRLPAWRSRLIAHFPAAALHFLPIFAFPTLGSGSSRADSDREHSIQPAGLSFPQTTAIFFTFFFFFCFVFLVSSLPRVVGVHALEPGHLSFSTNVKLPAYPTYLLRIDPATPEPKQNDSDIIAAGLPFLSIQPAVQLPSGCRVFFFFVPAAVATTAVSQSSRGRNTHN